MVQISGDKLNFKYSVLWSANILDNMVLFFSLKNMVTQDDNDIAHISYFGPAGLRWQSLGPGQETVCLSMLVVKSGSDLMASRWQR